MPTQDTQISPFFRLPPELRQHIYGLLFGPNDISLLQIRDRLYRNWPELACYRSLAVLAVCRTINVDASDFFHKTYKVHIHLDPFLARIPDYIAFRSASNIRSLRPVLGGFQKVNVSIQLMSNFQHQVYMTYLLRWMKCIFNSRTKPVRLTVQITKSNSTLHLTQQHSMLQTLQRIRTAQPTLFVDWGRHLNMQSPQSPGAWPLGTLEVENCERVESPASRESLSASKIDESQAFDAFLEKCADFKTFDRRSELRTSSRSTFRRTWYRLRHS